jgi:YHS domain-containing protein
MNKPKLHITLLAVALLGAGFGFAGEVKELGKAEVPHSYPLKTCVVSEDKLGEHGKAIKMSYEGTDVYLCCKDCIKDFKKDPAKYVKMVKDAEAKKK